MNENEKFNHIQKVANTVSVGTYTIGFATSVSDLMQVIQSEILKSLKWGF